jgi:hypothetical protein
MKNLELWTLIFSGATAFGTVGSVFLSLWLSRFHWKIFTIKYVRISSIIIELNNSQKSNLLIMFHNHQNVNMEIKNITLTFSSKKEESSYELGWKCDKEFILPFSQYELEIPLKQEWCIDTISKASKINLSIKTSLGNKTISFPKKYKNGLAMSLEINPDRVNQIRKKMGITNNLEN